MHAFVLVYLQFIELKIVDSLFVNSSEFMPAHTVTQKKNCLHEISCIKQPGM